MSARSPSAKPWAEKHAVMQIRIIEISPSCQHHEEHRYLSEFSPQGGFHTGVLQTGYTSMTYKLILSSSANYKQIRIQSLKLCLLTTYVARESGSISLWQITGKLKCRLYWNITHIAFSRMGSSAFCLSLSTVSFYIFGMSQQGSQSYASLVYSSATFRIHAE